MAMYLMFAIMGMALAALMVPMITTQAHTTRSDTSRVHALDAAQTGVNVMLGELRAAQVGGVGTSALLPCGSTSGVVNGVGSASYAVSIDYYMADPVTLTGTPKMRCLDGYGTYDPVTDNFTPKFARIISVGNDGTVGNGNTVGRTLATTYVFRTTNTNIPGGRIRIYPALSTSPELCVDAGSAAPSAGTLVRLQPCASPPLPQQILAYRSDLTLQLLSSVTATYPLGLCLDTAPPPTAGQSVVLGACAALGAPPYTQQWSFNDSGGYTASVATSAATGVLSSQCLSAPSQTAGVQVTLAACSLGGTSSPTQAWIPAPAVGAGAAQAPQLINYYEFGRCVDVTGQDVLAGHLIDYPCKQNPFPGAVAWNQKFTTPSIAALATSGTGQIYTTPTSGSGTGTRYCLTSPGAAGGYVTVLPCSGTNARQVWTVYNGISPLPYSTKYTIVDNGSRCLGITTPVLSEQWSSIDVDACTGETGQKWNATTNLSTSVLQDIDELPTVG
jgi:hypothetical protein